MTNSSAQAFTSPSGRTVFRRKHAKADGRRLILFGYSEPTGAPAPESLEGAGAGAELRWHPLLGEWSIYAAHRQNRTFMPSAAEDPLAPTRPGGPLTEVEFANFEVAVFQNRFAGLHPEADLKEGPHGVRMGVASGDCEVVVFSPDSDGNLGTLDQDRRQLLVSVWADRYDHLHDAGARFVMPFESRGREVGVTLPHPHGQIYAFPFVPETQARAAKAFADGFDLAALLPSWDDYIIERAGPLCAFVPPFARYPYEVWIAGRQAVQGPWAFDREGFEAYAYLLGAVTRRYDALFGREAPTMMSLQAAPGGQASNFQFTTQFYCLLRAPDRLKYFATVEHASRVFTVDVMPEAAAKVLREAI
ncbi:hypothetical protein [Parvularcula dongshanensis]|uniref:Galactose-1-phosphate uridylyltransferase n=1 Tax=Parvularcula dongshanensis TaxID=1173995 RepID=A0A840I821_9PROT|nr:UDPglucose--hexose-1-phosphate uridylyltransferase [Parvularcula dongshanensis]